MAVPADIALVTAAVARSHDADLAPTAAGLGGIGLSTAIVDWDDPTVDWGSFRLALVRSPWDYTRRLAEYLAWIDRVAAATILVNEPSVLRWCSDKHYLVELAERGGPVIPTTLLHPGDPIVLPEASEFVVKPTVSAGARDTERHTHEGRAGAIDHIGRLHAAGRDVVVQPYLAGVERRGETAVICFDGEPSHAIRKGPILVEGVREVVDDLYAVEDITARTATADELAVARRVLDLLPFDAPPTYARIDLIEDDAGRPLVLEVEANEPSLFLAEDPGSSARLAAAVARRLG